MKISPLLELPVELWMFILNQLDAPAFYQLMLTCRFFYNLQEDEKVNQPFWLSQLHRYRRETFIFSKKIHPKKQLETWVTDHAHETKNIIFSFPVGQFKVEAALKLIFDQLKLNCQMQSEALFDQQLTLIENTRYGATSVPTLIDFLFKPAGQFAQHDNLYYKIKDFADAEKAISENTANRKEPTNFSEIMESSISNDYQDFICFLFRYRVISKKITSIYYIYYPDLIHSIYISLPYTCSPSLEIELKQPKSTNEMMQFVDFVHANKGRYLHDMQQQVNQKFLRKPINIEDNEQPEQSKSNAWCLLY